MNNRIIKIIVIFILCMFTFNFSEGKANDDYDMELNDVKKIEVPIKNGYNIQQYDIDMVVNENNTYDITENITAYFNVPKHGIVREIPLRNKVERVDGSITKNNAKITNISVNEKFKKSKSREYQLIQIGNKNITLTGSKKYTIKYKYNIGKDKLKEIDELYFNLIGLEWDTNIGNVNFKITMPKEFDPSSLGFSTGKKGTVGTNIVSYKVTGKVITGSVNDVLYAGEALTVRLTLPDKYFVGASSNIDYYYVLVILFSLISVFITYKIWSKYGKDDTAIETVEFYPPEGYNSAEISYMYYGKSSTEGVISLLIYLANKGYLKIEETKIDEANDNKTKFKIVKLKEYDGNNEIERIFFRGLFRESRGEVTSSSLKESFYRIVDKVKIELGSKENKNKIYESLSSGKIKWIFLMIIAIFCLITIKPVLEFQRPAFLIFELLIPLGGIITFISIGYRQNLNMDIDEITTSVKGLANFFRIIILLVFCILPWFTLLLPAVVSSTENCVMSAIGVICMIIDMLFLKFMPKRTKFGTEMLGKIGGFARFLEIAEKNKLESLVEENPEYFYDILPYTYGLGISNIWMKQFEEMAIEKQPTWYESNRTFNFYNFNTFVNGTMNSIKGAMTSLPSPEYSSHYGGGFSGGGFSGGFSRGGRRTLLVIK